MNSPPGPASWCDTDHRFGVLVVEESTGRMVVTQPETADGIPVMTLDGGESWTVQGVAGLRRATNPERAKVGLGPRSVD